MKYDQNGHPIRPGGLPLSLHADGKLRWEVPGLRLSDLYPESHTDIQPGEVVTGPYGEFSWRADHSGNDTSVPNKRGSGLHGHMGDAA